MPEILEDGGDPSSLESTEQYGVRKASERARGFLDEAEDQLDTGARSGSVRRPVELAAIFYHDALFHGRSGADGLPDLAALQERGLRLADAVGSDAARELFDAERWLPSEHATGGREADSES